jgi:hypothetical protein
MATLVTNRPDLFCPRCKYDLRGLARPRCPECGLEFPAEAWAGGVLRDSVPTTLDRCDPWQPHQVLLRGLWELVRGALQPRRLVTTLDLDGPLLPAALMLTVGLLWVYCGATLLIATATFVHVGISPAAALRSAALFWSPRLLLLAVLLALATLGAVAHASVVHVERLTPRRILRLAAYWVPATTAAGAVPLAALLLLTPIVGWLLPWLPAACVIPAMLLSVIGQGTKRRRRSVRGVVVTVVCLLGWLGLGIVGSQLLLPLSLDPRPWVYF